MKIWSAAIWSQSYLLCTRILFGCALVLPMLTYGAVDFEPLSIVALLISLTAFLVCWRPVGNAATGWIVCITLICLGSVAVVIYLQSMRFPDNPFEHPSWKYVREFVGPVDGAISVSPEQTRADLIAWMPLLAFTVALKLFNRTREALVLITALSILNASVAAFSLVQFSFFPNSLGLGDKQFYVGSLTGLFVNRNSAGTFFGVGAIISIGLIVFLLQESDYRSMLKRLLHRIRLSVNERTAILYGIGAVLQILALAATQSRGAEASTFVAILGLVWIFNSGQSSKQRRQRNRTPTSLSMKIIRISIIAGVALILGVLVGQEAIYRMDAQSVDEARLCTYIATWHAVLDHWPWGSGFGSFQDVFPAYRTPDCSGIEGIWDAAHNSYLEGMLCLGVTFAVVLLVGYAVLIWAFANGLRSRRSYRFAPAIGLTSLVLISLHSFVDFSMQIPGNALFTATLFSACVTISCAKQTSPDRRP